MTLNFLLLFCLGATPALSSAADSGGTATAPHLEGHHLVWQEPLTGMEFLWISGGCFTMGQDAQERQELLQEAGSNRYQQFYSDETPPHQVCLDGYWLGRYEVTRKQWLTLMSVDPFPPGPPDLPAENISWLMAADFAEKLSERTGVDFRLPTEAEWEYAARANTHTAFYTGATINTEQANFNGNYPYGKGGVRGPYRAASLPVGSLPPNNFGLYEMLGNLWEWCADWYGENYYRTSPGNNPTGPDTGIEKVMRGGSWFTAARSLRAANRRGINPATTLEDCGFRLLCLRPAPNPKDLLSNPDF